MGRSHRRASLDIKEVRQHRVLASLVLGPGTLLTTILIAAAGWYLLGEAAGPRRVRWSAATTRSRQPA